MPEGRDDQRDDHLSTALRFVDAAEALAKQDGPPDQVTALAAMATAHAAIAAAIPPEPLEITFDGELDGAAWMEHAAEREALRRESARRSGS